MGFEELYRTHVQAVYGFLMFKLQDLSLVEDILQETFLAVHQSMDKLANVSSPKAWILTIAHHKMVDYLRKKPLAEHEQILHLEETGTMDNGSQLHVVELLSQLEDAERTIVYGLYVEGLSCQEIANILEIPEGTV